jgi:hypothetical protein
MNEAFVYCWSNHTNGRSYVGYHKGCIDDGYICSSKSEEFWEDFNNNKMKWSRQIIANGSIEDCRILEFEILKASNLNILYNNGYAKAVVMTEEVKEKLSKSLIGVKKSEETKRKMSEAQKRRDPKITQQRVEQMTNAKLGKTLSEETKKKISQANFGKRYQQSNKETVKECFVCGKKMRGSLLSRWHNKNCKERLVNVNKSQ